MVTINSANNKTGASGTVLQGQGVGTASGFSTATYPATTTANRILYSSATSVVGEITTAIDGVLITDHAAGVPSILANGTVNYVLTANTNAPPSWKAGPTQGIVTLNGNSGSATGTTVTIQTEGSSGNTRFTGSGSTLTLNLYDANSNTFIGYNACSASVGTSNVGFGQGSLAAVTGSQNAAYGGYSLIGLISGSNNSCFGYGAGYNYNGAESGNCILGYNFGTVGESNVMRLGGGTGTGTGQQNKAFISGVNGVTASNPVYVTINSSTDQLGVVSSIPNSFAPYSFKTTMNTSATNLTGDNTAAVVIFDTVVFDNGGGTNYSVSTGIYTIPVTGTWVFGGSLTVGNLAVGHIIMILKLNRVGIANDQVIECNPYVMCVAGDNTQVQIPFSQMVSGTAADQFELILTVANSTKTVWVRGSGYNSTFWGYRIA